MVMLSSDEQPEKAPSPMLVTLFGIVMLVSPVQPENAELPMLVPLVITTSNDLLPHCFATVDATVEDPVILVNPSHQAKAPPPILVTLFPIVALVNPSQEAKA